MSKLNLNELVVTSFETADAPAVALDAAASPRCFTPNTGCLGCPGSDVTDCAACDPTLQTVCYICPPITTFCEEG